MPATELCFVLAPGQNHFFVELADALQFELDRLGVASSVSSEGFPPPRDDLVYVLVPPHEFRGLAPRAHWPTPRQLERTIFYCLEQPGTKYFDEDVRMGRGPVGAVLDINAMGAREQRRAGVLAHHAPLGWTAAWSYGDPASANGAAPEVPERDIDLLHLGIYSSRRGEALARSARLLACRRTALMLGDDHGPNPGPQANFAVGRDKWRLLSRSRVLLNIHVGDRPYFEWLRVIQAICNGVLVVSEHSTGTAPLCAGEHFVSGRADALVGLAESFLEDEDLRERTASAAALLLEEALPLGGSAQLLAELADDVARRPGGSPRALQGALMLGGSASDAGIEQAAATARSVALHGAGAALEADGADDADLGSETAVVPWPDNGVAVESLAAPRGGKVASIDFPPGLVAPSPEASSDASGDTVLLSGPDVELAPGAIARLEAVLEADSAAAFAWGMVAREASVDGGPPALRNVFPWQPWRLADGCFLERPVVWREAVLDELRAAGGELQLDETADLDLYRRAAERGLYGIHVPAIVAFARPEQELR
jgi:hypothetical protein